MLNLTVLMWCRGGAGSGKKKSKTKMQYQFYNPPESECTIKKSLDRGKKKKITRSRGLLEMHKQLQNSLAKVQTEKANHGLALTVNWIE